MDNDYKKECLKKMYDFYHEAYANPSMPIGEFNKRMLELVMMIARDIYDENN